MCACKSAFTQGRGPALSQGFSDTLPLSQGPRSAPSAGPLQAAGGADDRRPRALLLWSEPERQHKPKLQPTPASLAVLGCAPPAGPCWNALGALGAALRLRSPDERPAPTPALRFLSVAPPPQSRDSRALFLAPPPRPWLGSAPVLMTPFLTPPLLWRHL
jgi:hypothetical protein